MITVEKSRLEATAGFIARTSGDAMHEIMNWTRLVGNATGLTMIATGSSVTAIRSVPVIDHARDFDVCVLADGLYACTKAMGTGAVRIEVLPDGSVRVSQGDALEATLETRSATEFPTITGFDGMVGCYAGTNPTEVFESMKHVAAAHPGNTPLAEVLIMMSGRSYLAGTLSAMRCDGSLVGPESDAVLGVRISNLWPLEQLGGQIKVFHDSNRVLICDDFGYVVLQKWSGNLANFPQRVSQMFSSLRQVGQVKVSRDSLLRSVMAASVILKPLSGKEEVFLDCVASKGSLEISAKVGRHSFREKMEASSSGAYRIPIHVSRLLSFLKNSADEHVFIQVMDSDAIPNPRSFVHMTDSRLHEAIGIPKPREVEVLQE